MAKDVAEKIIELNGGKPVNAVFVVGGGGKIPGYTERVADCLGIPHQRVAVRGEEVLTAVDFQVDNFKKDSLYVTPVGICTNYYIILFNRSMKISRSSIKRNNCTFPGTSPYKS